MRPSLHKHPCMMPLDCLAVISSCYMRWPDLSPLVLESSTDDSNSSPSSDNSSRTSQTLDSLFDARSSLSFHFSQHSLTPPEPVDSNPKEITEQLKNLTLDYSSPVVSRQDDDDDDGQPPNYNNNTTFHHRSPFLGCMEGLWLLDERIDDEARSELNRYLPFVDFHSVDKVVSTMRKSVSMTMKDDPESEESYRLLLDIRDSLWAEAIVLQSTVELECVKGNKGPLYQAVSRGVDAFTDAIATLERSRPDLMSGFRELRNHRLEKYPKHHYLRIIQPNLKPMFAPMPSYGLLCYPSNFLQNILVAAIQLLSRIS